MSISETLPLGVTAVMLPDLDLDEQLALCSRLGVTHYSIRPREIPEAQMGKPWGNWGNHKFDLTPARLAKEGREIRAAIESAGMVPFGTVPQAVVNDSDERMRLHFEGAVAAGAGRVRMAAENYPKEVFDYRAFMKRQVELFGRAVGIAREYRQKIVIETHTQSIAASPATALDICEHFSPDEIGTIFDIANFNLEGNLVPHFAVAVLADYIDHVHIGGLRRIPGAYDAAGFRQAGRQFCPLTESDMHVTAWLKALYEAFKGKRSVPLVIEVFTENVSGTQRLTEAVESLRRGLAVVGA